MIRTAFLACLIVAAAGAAEYRGQARPVIAEIRLADGRVLEQAQVLGDSAYTVTVKHGGRVEKIEKRQLPEQLLRQWPVDEQRGAAERREAELAAQRRQAEIAKGAQLAEKVRQENIREAKAQAKVNEKFDKERAAKEAAAKKKAEIKAGQLASARDGLLLTGFNQEQGGAAVRCYNAGDGPVRLDWRQLHALANDGSLVPAVDVRFSGKEVAGYDVSGGKSRTFTVIFNRTDLAAVGWADRPDLGWVNAKGAAVQAEEAVAAAKALAIERARQRNARGLTPIEGQLVGGRLP